MKVTMLDSHAGVVWPDRPAVHLRRGEHHDVPDKVGKKWVAIGLAKPYARPVVAVDHNAGVSRTVTRGRTRQDEGMKHG